MSDRIDERRHGRPRGLAARMATTAAVVVLAGVVVGTWACDPGMGETSLRGPAPVVTQGFAPNVASVAPVPATTRPQDVASAAPAADPAQTAARRLRAELTKRTFAASKTARAAARGTVSRSGIPVAERFEVSSTAYCLRGAMRTGVRTRNGMAAADPRVIPLGSVVRLTHPDGREVGIFVIMDTGGAIRGRDVDIYMASCGDARRWGRKRLVAEVLEIGSH